MSTSDKRTEDRRYFRTVGAYLLATAVTALFGAVYERFSHEVYSFFMIYAFAVPFLLGAVPFFLGQRSGRPYPDRRAADLLHAGIAALTAGCLMQGVLEIYGTSHPLLSVYWIAGAVLLTAGAVKLLIRPRRRRPCPAGPEGRT